MSEHFMKQNTTFFQAPMRHIIPKWSPWLQFKWKMCFLQLKVLIVQSHYPRPWQLILPMWMSDDQLPKANFLYWTWSIGARYIVLVYCASLTSGKNGIQFQIFFLKFSMTFICPSDEMTLVQTRGGQLLLLITFWICPTTEVLTQLIWIL